MHQVSLLSVRQALQLLALQAPQLLDLEVHLVLQVPLLSAQPVAKGLALVPLKALANQLQQLGTAYLAPVHPHLVLSLPLSVSIFRTNFLFHN